MTRYLSPKNDIVFKKVFGEHPHILKSFLNAVLPLESDEQIITLTYLSPEQVPVIPVLKRTIVDVKCTDQKGRQFIVEMQMQWTKSFEQRMLFNTSQAYVKQLERGELYHLLQPVYGLALVAETFEPDDVGWYHHYRLVNVAQTSRVIEGLQMIFIELPKFALSVVEGEHNHTVKHHMRDLWLRYMDEIDEKAGQAPLALSDVPEIQEALHLAETAAYSKAELLLYDAYWDSVSTEKTLLADSWIKGKEEGRHEGKQEGKQEGELQGILETLEILLPQRFSNIPESFWNFLRNADLKTLQECTKHFLGVASLKELADRLGFIDIEL